MKKLKLLDTFAGIGGFSYAAEKLVGGFKTVQFIEIDPYCQQVLNKNFPNIPIHDDITTYRAEPYSADVITGGFPCTDISQAGRREGITETTRSGLWFQLIRTIRMVRPKYFILENVSAILNNGMDIVLRDIYEAGYDAEWCCIPSSFVGACHQRDRWWLIGYPSNTNSMQRLDVLRQESEQRQETQQGTSDRNNRSGNVADSDNNGQQERGFETRNEIITRQDTQIIRSTNTSNIERQSDDGSNKTESRIDENLSRSSDRGKTISTQTGGICKLLEETNNNKGTCRENKNQENNDRTLVSEGQSRIQFPQYRELGRNKTPLENNSIRQGDDHSSEQRMDYKESNVANSNNNGSSSSKKSRSIEKTNGGAEEREDISVQSEGSGEPTNSTDFQQSSSNSKSQFSNVTKPEHLINKKSSTSEFRNSSVKTSNSDSNRLQREVGSRVYRPTWKTQNIRCLNPNWRQYISKPTICRGDDGLSTKLDASQRIQRLKQLGNTIVPQVAAIPLQRVIQLEREQQ